VRISGTGTPGGGTAVSIANASRNRISSLRPLANFRVAGLADSDEPGRPGPGSTVTRRWHVAPAHTDHWHPVWGPGPVRGFEPGSISGLRRAIQRREG
jgi:hypothetical protein